MASSEDQARQERAADLRRIAEEQRKAAASAAKERKS